MSTFIAVDVGGTQIRVATYTAEGVEPLQLTRIPTRTSKDTALTRLIDQIQSSWPAQDTVQTISVAAPGPVNHKLGIIHAAPNIPGWKDVPLKQILQDRFQVPTLVNNDANLATLGEWRYGAGQGHNNLIFFTISTGIGGGVITDGRLLVGESGLATELGHVTLWPDGPLCGCGKRGHFEALASGTAIAAYVGIELSKGRPSILSSQPNLTAKEISKAAKTGDELALEAFTRAGYFIGIGIANYLHIFNPTLIILGGGVSQSLPIFREAMEKSLQESVISPAYLRDLTITTAALRDDAGLLGALALARSPQWEVI
jgi:glucokinase